MAKKNLSKVKVEDFPEYSLEEVCSITMKGKSLSREQQQMIAQKMYIVFKQEWNKLFPDRPL